MDVAVLLLLTFFLAVTFRYDVLRNDRYLVLRNVAASRGVGALHGCPRGRALAGSGPAAAVAGATSARSPGSVADSGEQAADYSPLVRMISAASLIRRRARGAIDPQEGWGSTRVLHRGRWSGGCGRAATDTTSVPGAEPTSPPC